MRPVRIAGWDLNDTSGGDGFCVSVYLQGCPHHCPGCHNPETWSFDGGKWFLADDNSILDFINKVIEKINANGITRNLNILGRRTSLPREWRIYYVISRKG